MDLPILIGIGLFAIILYFIFKDRLRPEKKAKEKWFAPEGVRKSSRPGAPLMGNCNYCGEKVSMPYKCKFCGQIFCDEHRLPESHECSGIKGLRREKHR